MYNPFDDVVLSLVLDKIAASLLQTPRKILILYNNPKWGHIIEQRESFVRVTEFMFWGFNFTVYANK